MPIQGKYQYYAICGRLAGNGERWNPGISLVYTWITNEGLDIDGWMGWMKVEQNSAINLTGNGQIIMIPHNSRAAKKAERFPSS